MLSNAVRQKIEERFGKPIRYSKDCEALAASIQKACQERISPTTLKRLFGFAKTIDQPRLFTLDVLALYTGYPNWHSLLDKVDSANAAMAVDPLLNRTQASMSNTQGVYRLNHQISIYKATQSIDTKKIVALATELGHLPAFIPFVTETIGIAARQNNAEFLAEVFSLPRLFDPTVHSDLDLYYIGQAMGLTLRNFPELAQQLIQPLANNRNARQYLIEWFVDEDFLNGYYGKLLDAYHPYKRENIADKLFYYALKYKQCLQEGDVVGRIGWYRKMKELKLPDPLYEILAARFLGTCLAEERDHIFQPSSPYYTMIQQCMYKSIYDKSVNFVFFLGRELYLHKRLDWLVQLIVDFEKFPAENQPEDKLHWTLNLENQLLVYRAFVAHLLSDSKKARELIKQVDMHLFDPFIYHQMQQDYKEIRKCIL
jgi:hypothetical protein